MLILQPGDRIELSYEDAPATPIRATVGRLLTDWDEGMGIEVEAMWLVGSKISVDEPGGIDAKQVVLLGTDSQYRLDGRPVTVRKTQEQLVGEERTIRIGIIGAGQIGGTLTRRLEQLGHEVFVANSRGPSSLAGLANETGAKAVTVRGRPARAKWSS